MPSVCITFQVYQRCRLRSYSFFDIGGTHDYEDEGHNRKLLDLAADTCYLPANRLLLDLLDEYRGDVRISFSLPGVFLERMERDRPDVVESFQRLAYTGCVEFLCETYYRSLAALYSLQEFREQVTDQTKIIHSLFGLKPVTFCHTELMYHNALACQAEQTGCRAILACTTDKVMGGEVINLFMDYAALGIGPQPDTGICAFLRSLPKVMARHPDFRFRTPAEVARERAPTEDLDVPAGAFGVQPEAALTDWLGNPLQQEAIHALYEREADVKRKNNPVLLHIWRCLQSADHFLAMCTQKLSDGDVHNYLDPSESPYDAYINYMNILEDFFRRLDDVPKKKVRKNTLPMVAHNCKE